MKKKSLNIAAFKKLLEEGKICIPKLHPFEEAMMETTLHRQRLFSEIVDLCMPRPMQGETRGDYVNQFDKLTREGYKLNLVSGFYFWSER